MPSFQISTLLLTLLLAIGLMAVMGPGVKNIIIALALVFIPTYGRVVRGSVLSIRQKEYIEAARNAGSGDLKIIFLHAGAAGPVPERHTASKRPHGETPG